MITIEIRPADTRKQNENKKVKLENSVFFGALPSSLSQFPQFFAAKGTRRKKERKEAKIDFEFCFFHSPISRPTFFSFLFLFF